MVIADTGFWFALLWRKDKHHQRAVALHRELDEDFITTWPVLTEASHLFLARANGELAMQLVEAAARGDILIAPQGNQSSRRMGQLMEQYSELPMDLADASLVVLAEEMGSGRILSTDRRDFGAYRWKNRKPFENLMFPDD
jgi:uncharacterized protein